MRSLLMVVLLCTTISAQKSRFVYLNPKPNSVSVTINPTIIVKPEFFTDLHDFSIQLFSESGKVIDGNKQIIQNQNTIIFKPDYSLENNEKIIVRIVDSRGQEVYKYSFNTKTEKKLPLNDSEDDLNYSDKSDLISSGKIKVINGVSVPGDFPLFDVKVNKGTASGSIFISRNGNYPYIAIYNNDGTPVFYQKLKNRSRLFDYQPSTGTIFQFTGNEFLEWDNNYEVIRSVQSSNDQKIDGHGIAVRENGNALLLIKDYETVDMSQIIEGGSSSAELYSHNIQEIDREGNLVFEWRSKDHFNVLDAIYEDLKADKIDYVHSNAISIDYDGHILLCSRHLSEITKINSQSGAIIWRFGGVNNQFEFIDDSDKFYYQHDIRPVEGKPNSYTLFDNGNNRIGNFSRAVEYQLDTVNWTATKVWEYRNSPDIYTPNRSGAQRLTNGNTIINWAQVGLPKAMEVTPEGEVVYEMDFADEGASYRTNRYEWSGKAKVPYLIVESSSGGINLIFNKFGDEDVAGFVIYGGLEQNSENIIDTVYNNYTTLTDLEVLEEYFFRVKSFKGNGELSNFSNEDSAIMKFVNAGENQIVNGDFTDGTSYWSLDLLNSAKADIYVLEGEVKIDIKNGGRLANEISLFQNNLSLERGKDYVFEFEAYAENPRTIDAKIINVMFSTNYGVIPSTFIDTVKKLYSFPFTMTNASDHAARVVFNCGGDTTDVYFANILLKEDVSTSVSKEEVIPDKIKLYQNYPNPFSAGGGSAYGGNPFTTIEYTIGNIVINSKEGYKSSSIGSEHVPITLVVYDILGRQVTTLVNKQQSPGHYKVNFDASGLSSGVYIYQLRVGQKSISKKMMLLR
jgi:hypothetical protein